MNHAERVKKLAGTWVCKAEARYGPYADPMEWAAADEAKAELHTAIDAMQSALDDAVAKLAARVAEVERYRKDAERLQAFLVRQGLLEVALCTPDVNAKYGAWWLLWPVYSVNKTNDPLSYGNSEAEAIDAALSKEVKGG